MWCSRNTGAHICHRCGEHGSWFDLKKKVVRIFSGRRGSTLQRRDGFIWRICGIGAPFEVSRAFEDSVMRGCFVPLASFLVLSPFDNFFFLPAFLLRRRESLTFLLLSDSSDRERALSPRRRVGGLSFSPHPVAVLICRPRFPSGSVRSGSRKGVFQQPLLECVRRLALPCCGRDGLVFLLLAAATPSDVASSLYPLQRV